jgi:F0F1-type ATP synthase membrane subunit b/b'
MSRIEDDLLDARRDLKEKETALNELRAVVEDLHRQAVGRGPHGGPGELDNVL